MANEIRAVLTFKDETTRLSRNGQQLPSDAVPHPGRTFFFFFFFILKDSYLDKCYLISWDCYRGHFRHNEVALVSLSLKIFAQPPCWKFKQYKGIVWDWWFVFCGVTNPIKEGKKRPGLYDGTALLKLLSVSTCSAVGMKCVQSFMNVPQVKRC